METKPHQNNEAYLAFQALKEPDKLDKTEIIKTLVCLNKYLDLLCHNISKSNPKHRFIYRWIFTNEFTDKDVPNYCKANIFAANESLKRIITILEQQSIVPVFRRMLIDFICDLKEFINYFDAEQNYKWLIVNTNSHITNFYFNLAQNTFYYGKPGEHEQENLCLSSSTPFFIRQSIEYKIKRILGIEHIEINGKTHKTQSIVYFKTLRNNKQFYKTRDFDFEIVEKVHSWTNLYIHGGYRPRPWLTETALNYLKELFYNGELSNSSSFSIYAGIEIVESDLKDLLDKTQNSIKKEIGQDASIIWLTKPELAYLKDNKYIK